VATDTLALALGGEALDQFADGLVDRIAAQVLDRLNEQHLEADRWMDSAEAARYIGRSKDALHKLTGAREIPFSQSAPGAKCYFKKSELDRWMEA